MRPERRVGAEAHASRASHKEALPCEQLWPPSEKSRGEAVGLGAEPLATIENIGRFKMPNIASILKDEILRLARKEVRNEIEGLKKASAKYRSDISDLKRRVAALEKHQTRDDGKNAHKAPTNPDGESITRFRFSAKRFAAQRQKLGLSAVEIGTLIGVSAQTVYNWESEKSRPRQSQLVAIASFRRMGKRQIIARLADQTD